MQSIKKIKPGVFERFGIISEMLARRSVPLSFAAEWEAMGCCIGHMLKVWLLHLLQSSRLFRQGKESALSLTQVHL